MADSIDRIYRDGAWVDVWPTTTILGDYDFTKAETLQKFTQQTNGLGYFTVTSRGLEPRFTSYKSNDWGDMFIAIESPTEIVLGNFEFSIDSYMYDTGGKLAKINVFLLDSNNVMAAQFVISDSWSNTGRYVFHAYVRENTIFSEYDVTTTRNGLNSMKRTNQSVTYSFNGSVIKSISYSDALRVKKIQICFGRYSTYGVDDMYLKSLSIKKL